LSNVPETGTLVKIDGEDRPAGAVAALEDETHFQKSLAMVIEERDRLTQALTRLGFDVLPSAANFVFARHPARGGAGLAAELRAQAVLVRHFARPRISDYLRITVGTNAQTDILLAALARCLDKGPDADARS
jgi:histidinol-phosphate aminotransferase